ncbi:MAG: ABC transporter ATP-binding protein [Acidobacteriaceae bacterium]|nr:ABC transporter ATP-binding protein [Acidobacteriaceae bacterium]MBV9779494.1 ABC transporter ATP-binding protein [Acidobacteriaceae bacterium]
MSTESAIWAESLSKVYRSGGSELVVFKDLSLEVRRGERLAIIGESGAGKSTLMHLLGGLDRSSRGTIFFGGRETTSLEEGALANFRNREIGFVWQNPSLLPEFTALENVMMPLLIRGVSREEAAARSAACLEEVRLGNRGPHRAGELSGGEQQRVGLARALVGRPNVLLADEPTGNLDFRTAEVIINLLWDLHRSHNLTSIFVTHNLALANRCDRVLQLKKGSLYEPSLMELQEAGLVQDATRLDGGTYV